MCGMFVRISSGGILEKNLAPRPRWILPIMLTAENKMKNVAKSSCAQRGMLSVISDSCLIIRMGYFCFSCRTLSSSTAGREARIQGGTLPAVGWSVLLAVQQNCLRGFRTQYRLTPNPQELIGVATYPHLLCENSCTTVLWTTTT